MYFIDSFQREHGTSICRLSLQYNIVDEVDEASNVKINSYPKIFNKKQIASKVLHSLMHTFTKWLHLSRYLSNKTK